MHKSLFSVLLFFSVATFANGLNITVWKSDVLGPREDREFVCTRIDKDVIPINMVAGEKLSSTISFSLFRLQHCGQMMISNHKSLG